MAGAPFAAPSDLATFWRPLSEVEEERAPILLGLASAIIRQKFATIDSRVTRREVDPSIVTYVACMMVRRFMSSRDMDAPIQEGIGEATSQWQAGAVAAMSKLDPEEVGLLTPYRRGRPRNFTLTPGIPLP